MNIDTKIFRKKANQIKQYMKQIIHYAKVIYSKGTAVSILKYQCVIHYIFFNCITMSIDSEKAFSKIQQPFTINKINKNK